MKILPVVIFAILLISSCSPKYKSANVKKSETFAVDTADITNNFYDNTETTQFQLPELQIEGEIANPGRADYSGLKIHSVFVKEALLDSAGGNRFIGAYRYDGYSLFDILNNVVLKKANADEFNPIIDLFVEVENAKGEKAVFSWGEIYYPNAINRIIIATSVSRIVPSKSKDLWPLPEESKVVAANDLITERNISSPVKITVKSYTRSFKVDRAITPLYKEDFSVFRGDEKVATLAPVKEKEDVTYNTIFYGRGRGIHSTSPFYGMLLKVHLEKYYPLTRENLRTGIVCLCGLDGYRCAVSYSELFNRNDQQEFLLVRTEKDESGGLFRVFPAADFFSDRAVKSLSEVRLDLF